MNRRPRLPFAAAVLLALALGIAPARADEVPNSADSAPAAHDARSSGPQSAGTRAGAAPPIFDPANSDLLPLEEFERQDFQRDHGPLVNSLRGMLERVTKLEGELAARKNPSDEAGKRTAQEIERLKARVEQHSVQLTDLLVAEGVPGWLLAHLNHAPKGPNRLERYATGLTLLIDLDPSQRDLFERVIPQIEAGWLALAAQKERMTLALKQSSLEPAAQGALLATFDQQAREIEKRYWYITDYVLDETQAVALYDLLPTPLKQKAGAIEHLYALAGLTPSQGARLRSILTEVEAESSPDQVALQRLQREAKAANLGKEEAQKQREEMAAVQNRLRELTRYSAQAIKDILTPEQVMSYRSIPPRLSENDRRQETRRLMEGLPLSSEQLQSLEALQRTAQDERREMEGKLRELRDQSADYGPDSPQMTGMNLMMNTVRGESDALRRKLVGVAMLRVLTPDQISLWVLGHYGQKR